MPGRYSMMDIATLSQPIVASLEDSNACYRDAVQWLYSFATYQEKPAGLYAASKLNLDRMRAILARLGNPHEKFRSVHIAGTKGKGSTAAICDSILRAAGISTGLYTSPHLHTFCERIRENGAPISRDAVIAGVARLRALQPDFPEAIVFEWITALAFDYFARAGVEFVVVETGIGGRLDSTNVITPRVSVITSISYDHTTVLGNTLTLIAREKAGIIKPRVPVVCAPQVDEARAVIEETAHERGAELVAITSELEFEVAGFEFQVDPEKTSLDSQSFVFRRANSKPESWNLKLLGHHQLANAAAAIAAMKTLAAQGVPIAEEAIRVGIENARWAGRFEILERAPYLIVDGAHNGDSARQLVATIDALFDGARVQWVFGASNDKNVSSILAELLPRSPALILTRAAHPRACDPRELATLAEAYGAATVVTENVAEAIATARQRADQFEVTVVTGSLFVVADVRAQVLRARGEVIEGDE